jgi:hypothetical protein
VNPVNWLPTRSLPLINEDWDNSTRGIIMTRHALLATTLLLLLPFSLLAEPLPRGDASSVGIQAEALKTAAEELK